MVSLTVSSLQTIPGLALRVDFESTETSPQAFEGPLPSLWLLFLPCQPLRSILALETGFEGSLAVLLLKR